MEYSGVKVEVKGKFPFKIRKQEPLVFNRQIISLPGIGNLLFKNDQSIKKFKLLPLA